MIKHFGNRSLRVKDVRRYLEAGGDINYRGGSMAWTLLHFAAEDCDPEIIRLLAAHGADLNAQDQNGWTPLHLAVDSDMDSSGRGGRRAIALPTVQALIEFGADETLRAADVVRHRETLLSAMVRRFCMIHLYDQEPPNQTLQWTGTASRVVVN